MSISNLNNLSFSFDIGHSSMGWSVFDRNEYQLFPNVIATGVVIFDTETCQAKQRGVYRHMRRNITARKNRIRRIRDVLVQMQVLSIDELDNLKTDYPWLLAAKVLANKKTLNWGELWAVIRYYCHNRAYDGNAGWASNIVEDKDDNQKLENAKNLMYKHNTSTQAETMCAFLGVDLSSDKNPKLKKYYKGENLAFPRKLVEKEVERIIDAHINILPKCDENFKHLILGKWQEFARNLGLDIPKLANNFTKDKGLLFGQYIPKFDNRIIAKCPITNKKVPNKHSREYLEFRWKSLLSNMVLPEGVDTLIFRQKLDDFLHLFPKITGSTLKTALKEFIIENFGLLPSNFESMFLSDDMADFVLDPVKTEILKLLYSSKGRKSPDEELVKELWSLIPKFALTQIFRGDKSKTYSLGSIAKLLDEAKSEKLIECLKKIYSLDKKNKLSFEEVLAKAISITKEKGRAPYAREVMNQACQEIMQGTDPRSEGGAIYIKEESLDPNIDRWTNNHLVRHRLKMFQRLYKNMVDKYAGGDLSKVSDVSIEVIKDLQSFSGLDTKEKAAILNNIVKHHKSVSAYIKEACPELETNGSILRKARIADDLGWKCPYTGEAYSPSELFFSESMELEHIIPRSMRPSDSLDSLVITWKAVNDMKGQRTAMEFIREFEGKEVAGKRNYSIQSLKKYEDFVKNIKRPQHSFADVDIKRIKKRNVLLKMEHYNKKESDFLPRDLTQTSHLNKLAFKALKLMYKDEAKLPKFTHIAGSITATIRKNWDLLPLMGQVCPEIFEEINGDKVMRNKDDIRSITHLHHAIDAISLGLAATLFPNTKRFYELISKRHHNKAEREELSKSALIRFSEKGWGLIDLSDEFREQAQNAINNAKVIKHIPKKMSGLKVEETLWRVIGENEDGTVNIKQYTTNPNGDTRRKIKTAKENKKKLLGYEPKDMLKSKLARNKAVFVIKENYGVALSNPPEIILFHNVWQRLQELKEKNNGIMPQVLRRGHIIEVKEGKYKGIWSVKSIKNNTKSGILIDMLNPIFTKLKSKTTYSKENIKIKALIDGKMSVLNNGLLGD